MIHSSVDTHRGTGTMPKEPVYDLYNFRTEFDTDRGRIAGIAYARMRSQIEASEAKGGYWPDRKRDAKIRYGIFYALQNANALPNGITSPDQIRY